MVSPFFCSVDYFPLTAFAYPPHCTLQGTPEAAQRADPAAVHPDPLTAHHGKPCLERLGLLGRHGFDNAQKTVASYYAFAYSHRQHIIFHHYVLTPSISFRLLYLFLH